MLEFSDFISDQNSMDHPLAGGSFTWSNNTSWSRIDCFIVSLDWEAKYPDLLQKRFLEYAPIISPFFSIVIASKGPKDPFKFENMWLKANGFVDQVRLWWLSYRFRGIPSFILAPKLKALKVDIKRRNEQVFGNVELLNREEIRRAKYFR
jgi:hypothetical protein